MRMKECCNKKKIYEDFVVGKGNFLVITVGCNPTKKEGACSRDGEYLLQAQIRENMLKLLLL